MTINGATMFSLRDYLDSALPITVSRVPFNFSGG